MPIPYPAAEIKERIISFITSKGPSLPIQVSREIKISPLFASAFLSELYREGKLRMSNMKVGSSPLYIIPGQETQLENFIEHLNQREKEAFFLIKKEKILEDETQSPIIRVALRAIPDFAISINQTIEGEQKLFWKYLSLPDAELEIMLNQKINKMKKKPEQEKQVVQKSLPQQIETPQKVNPKDVEDDVISTQIDKSPQKVQTEQKIKKEKVKQPQGDTEWALRIKSYLSSNKIELLEQIEDKKKEYLAKVRIDTLLGKQEYLLVAKDKKKITDIDLTLAHHQSQLEKMPALIIAPGSLDKKASEQISLWRNLIKFDKLK